MKINVLTIVKGITSLVASAGAGAVVGNLVKATTPLESSKLQKILVGVGGYTIGAVLGDLSAKYVNDQIDGYAERISAIIIRPTEAESIPAPETVEDAKEAIVDDTSSIITNITTLKNNKKPSESE